MVCLLVAGCGGATSQPASAETPEQQAERVFLLAQDFLAKGQTQKAYAAFHQLIKNFPTSPYAIKANAQLTKAREDAGRKLKKSRPNR